MVALGGSLGFFMFITTGIIYFVTKKYITDIYYDRATKKFTASRYSFFLRRKEIEYTADDVEVPGVIIPVVTNIKNPKDPPRATIRGNVKLSALL
jgi:hypothetical protein